MKQQINRKNENDINPCCCCSDVYSDDEFFDAKDVSNTIAEARHFMYVRQSIATYQVDCMIDVARIENNLNSLSMDDRSLLTECIETRIQKIKDAVAENQKFLNLLLLDDKSFQYSRTKNESEILLPGTKGSQYSCESYHTNSADMNESQTRQPCKRYSIPVGIRARNASKVRSTLRQFVRDWSDEGKLEREASYNPLLEDLNEYLNIEEYFKVHNKIPRVLCPGTGLGRLALEVVQKGYKCQGNEFSYYMLLGSNLMLNSDFEPYSCTIYPYCLSTSNRVNLDDHLQPIKIPDLSLANLLYSFKDFSMCAGEFVEVYQCQKQEWDAVLTCFFLDTAKNIISYIRTISTILKTGGIWANIGPLLYHFVEMPNELSIELSWEELRNIIEKYFLIVKEEQRDAYYTTNPKSIMQVQYHCIHFVAIRNEVPMEGQSFPSY